jgi:hypothetical protein
MGQVFSTSNATRPTTINNPENNTQQNNNSTGIWEYFSSILHSITPNIFLTSHIDDKREVHHEQEVHNKRMVCYEKDLYTEEEHEYTRRRRLSGPTIAFDNYKGCLGYDRLWVDADIPTAEDLNDFVKKYPTPEIKFPIYILDDLSAEEIRKLNAPALSRIFSDKKLVCYDPVITTKLIYNIPDNTLREIKENIFYYLSKCGKGFISHFIKARELINLATSVIENLDHHILSALNKNTISGLDERFINNLSEDTISSLDSSFFNHLSDRTCQNLEPHVFKHIKYDTFKELDAKFFTRLNDEILLNLSKEKQEIIEKFILEELEKKSPNSAKIAASMDSDLLENLLEKLLLKIRQDASPQDLLNSQDLGTP